MAQQKWIRLWIMRFQVQSLASLSGLRIRCCPELWCRLQTRLRSGVTVALGRPAATALIGHLDWEPPYATGAALKRQKDKKKKINVWKSVFPYQQQAIRKCDFSKVSIFISYENFKGPSNNFNKICPSSMRAILKLWKKIKQT